MTNTRKGQAMKRQTAREVRATTTPVTPRLIKPESQLDKFRKLQEAMARRAYELFEGRGGEQGQDLADWLRAESDILQPLPIKVTEYIETGWLWRLNCRASALRKSRSVLSHGASSS